MAITGIKKFLIATIAIFCIFVTIISIRQLNDDASDDGMFVKQNNNVRGEKARKRTTFIYPELKYTPENYPEFDSLKTIVDRWNPDVSDLPERFIERLQHFNYSSLYERKLSEVFRNAELPYKLYNVPEVDVVSKRWTDTYLRKNFKSQTYHVEKSTSNHFMYWNMRSSFDKDFVPPTSLVDMSFGQWRQKAEYADTTHISNDSEYYYLMTGTTTKDHTGYSFISRDLPIFATSENNYFITNTKANKGF
jgi:hypothetical protein